MRCQFIVPLAIPLLLGSAAMAAPPRQDGCEVFKILSNGERIRMGIKQDKTTSAGVDGKSAAASASGRSSSASSSSSSVSMSSSSSSSTGGHARATSSYTDDAGRTITTTRDEAGCRITIDERNR